MTRPSLALVCDASAQTGLGHWVRSAAVADELAARGWQVTAVHAPDAEVQVLEEGSTRGWAHCVVGRAPSVLGPALDKLAPTAVLIDTYRLDGDCVSALRKPERISILVDDLNNRGFLDVDLVVNQNLGADTQNYRHVTDARLLLGPTFAMLRPQFRELRNAGLRRLENQPDKPSTIFVMMGGSDATGTLTPVLSGCAEAFPRAHIRAVVPTHRAEKIDRIAPAGRIETLAPTPHVAQEMIDADLVVTAGGTSVWELCALGRPFGIIVVADNQQDATRRLEHSGAALRLAEIPVDPHGLASSLRASVKNKATVVDRARRAAALVDGHGCPRVADEIEQACVPEIPRHMHSCRQEGEQ